MDYDYIEKLVSDCKNGDKNSKEKLIEEFKPYIINISKRTFIYGYEFEDLMNECCTILLRCVSLYNMESHRFVAYATNGIKNSINDIICRSVKNSRTCGASALPLDDFREETFISDTPQTLDILCSKCDSDFLKKSLKQLSQIERDIIYHVFFKEKTLKSFAEQKGISYSYAVKIKRRSLNKLSKLLAPYFCMK